METLVRPAARRPRLTLWALRTVLTVHLLVVLAQPVLAGLFLVGDVDAIGWHATLGSTLAALALLVIGAALGYVLVRRRGWWLLAVAVLLFLADGFQIGMGYERVLDIHVPLGVAIVVGSVLLAGWAWTPGAANPRAGRPGSAR